MLLMKRQSKHRILPGAGCEWLRTIEADKEGQESWRLPGSSEVRIAAGDCPLD